MTEGASRHRISMTIRLQNLTNVATYLTHSIAPSRTTSSQQLSSDSRQTPNRLHSIDVAIALSHLHAAFPDVHRPQGMTILLDLLDVPDAPVALLQYRVELEDFRLGSPRLLCLCLCRSSRESGGSRRIYRPWLRLAWGFKLRLGRYGGVEGASSLVGRRSGRIYIWAADSRNTSMFETQPPDHFSL